MRYSKYKSFKLFLLLTAVVFAATLIAGVLCFGAYGNAGGKSAEAAITYDEYTASTNPTSNSYNLCQFIVCIYADTTWGSIDVPSSSFTNTPSTSSVSFTWTNYKFTYTPKGYNWTSTTSFTLRYKVAGRYSDEDTSKSSTRTTLYNNVTGSSYSTKSLTRSGNTFSYSGGSYSQDISAYARSDGTDYAYYMLVGYLILSSSNFKAITYTLTYNANGGTVSPTSQSVTFGSTSVTTPTPTHSGGFSFLGWWRSTSTTYTGGTWNIANNTTVYAGWNYVVTFNSNGGSACSAQTMTTPYYNSLPTPTYSGYTFIGWYTSSTFSGSAVSTSTLVSSSHTLYAKWQATVSFNSNGGSECSAQTEYLTRPYSSLPTSTKEGVHLYGWYKETNFSGAKVTTSTIVTNNHTLYARWGIYITLNLQGGAGATSIFAPYNEPMISSTPPTLTGFTFVGYFTEPCGKGVQYYNNLMQSTHTNDLVDETVLYACWQSTLNLDLQGGTGDTSIIGIYNDGMPEILKPIRSGYTFGGYFTGQNGTGTRYYTNSMSSAHLNDLPNGTTLYAYWMINTYMLYYNPNGGSVSATEASVTFGSTVTPPTPTRSGYTFFGWYIDGEIYAGGIWTFTENKTATAKWGYTLTFNANGGWVTPGTMAIFDKDVVTTPIPTRTGCIFDGWQIGSTAYYGGIWTYTANQTATAKWICEFNATLNNGAEGTITGTANGWYAAGSSITLTATASTGYAFDYWMINGTKSTSASYTGTLNQHTSAVAYFKQTNPTANVYASNGTIASTYLNLEPESYSATLRITPETGKYVETISFDNVAYYTIDSWSSTLYANSTFAQNVRYQANEGNNDLWLTFNYYNTTKPVNVYVKLTTTKYADLSVPKNTGGALDGIAVSANFGGTVTLVGDDYESLADSDTIICSAKLAQGGYEFVGWVYADSPSNILSTEMSEKFKKSDIYGRQLMACFKPTDDNPNYNMQLDNE